MCLCQVHHDLDGSVEVHLLGGVKKRDLGAYQPGTVCELLLRLLEVFLVLLGELELRVAIRRIIALVNEEAVEVLGGPRFPIPLVFVFLHLGVIHKHFPCPESCAALVQVHQEQRLGILRSWIRHCLIFLDRACKQDLWPEPDSKMAAGQAVQRCSLTRALITWSC